MNSDAFADITRAGFPMLGHQHFTIDLSSIMFFIKETFVRSQSAQNFFQWSRTDIVSREGLQASAFKALCFSLMHLARQNTSRQLRVCLYLGNPDSRVRTIGRIVIVL